MKNQLISVFSVILLIFIFQGCNEETTTSCDCDKTEFVTDFTDREGVIYYLDDIHMKAWVISVRSSDNSQILVGKICNPNSSSVKAIIGNIPSEPFVMTPVIFSGRITQLCPDETTPVHQSNVSVFYIKVDNINLK